MTALSWALGLDLGLNHCALVRIDFYNDEPSIVSTLHLVQRTKRERRAAPIHHVILARLAQNIAERLPHGELGFRVGIDWNPTEVFWGDRKSAIYKTFLYGYLYREILGLGGVPLIIPPARVRATFGLQQTAFKVDVWNMAKLRHPALERYDTRTEDEKDALLLGMIAYLHGSEVQDEPEPSKAGVPAGSKSDHATQRAAKVPRRRRLAE